VPHRLLGLQIVSRMSERRLFFFFFFCVQGHKGLVGNCGRLLQESGVTTLADWEHVSSVRLLRTVSSLRNYGSIARSVREQSPEERAVLLGVLLAGHAVICTADRQRLTGSMVSDGLLSASKEVDLWHMQKLLLHPKRQLRSCSCPVCQFAEGSLPQIASWLRFRQHHCALHCNDMAGSRQRKSSMPRGRFYLRI